MKQYKKGLGVNSMLEFLDVVTLDDNNDYIVLKVINMNNVNYVSLVNKDNYYDFKLLEEVNKSNELVLREVVDDTILEKIKLQTMKDMRKLLNKIV
jgi:hypothetical protein